MALTEGGEVLLWGRLGAAAALGGPSVVGDAFRVCIVDIALGGGHALLVSDDANLWSFGEVRGTRPTESPTEYRTECPTDPCSSLEWQC